MISEIKTRSGTRSVNVDKYKARSTHFHEEGALEEPSLDIFRVTILPFVQAPNPVVVRCTMSVKAVADFGPNANEKNGKSIEQPG